jgi:tetratricopeptide (TPR) repeat protein
MPTASWLGNWDEARQHYALANELDKRTGDVLGAALGRNNLGRVVGRLGRHDEALELLREARDRAADVGAGTQLIEADARIAELHVFRARPAEALAVADTARRGPRSIMR